MNLTPEARNRFESKIIPEPMSGCWLWTAGTVRDGYGVFSIDGKNYRAHRIAWLISGREIPSGMSLLHKCDVRCCVNPLHLSLGSSTDNMEDMVRKGRSLRGDNNPSRLHPESLRRGHGAFPNRNVATGERNGNSKLTAEVVAHIREKYASGLYSQQKLGNEYGLHQATVSSIVLRKTWRQVVA